MTLNNLKSLLHCYISLKDDFVFPVFDLGDSHLRASK